MPRKPYDFFDCFDNAQLPPAFDPEAAYRFLSQHQDAICNMRLAHWRGDIDDLTFWNTLEKYQAENGGFMGGIDPDYTGKVGSIHSTIEAMRIAINHQQFEGPEIDKLVSFLRQSALPDNSWQELKEVTDTPECPEWYKPAEFRIYETSCIGGYALEFGASDLWTQAVRYVRQAWLDMPFADTAHPYWAVLLLLGRSKAPADRSITLDALDNLGAFARKHNIDPYDCSTVIEILSGLDFPEADDMLLRLYDMLGAAQDPKDGGIRTEYGHRLRPAATFNALIAAAMLAQRGLVEA